MMMVREFHAQHRQDPASVTGSRTPSCSPTFPRWCRCCGSTSSARCGGSQSCARGEHGQGTPAPEPEEKELPLSVLLDEPATARAASWPARAALKQEHHAQQERLKRHTAVLGGSGSGKTTLALCIIEQLLLQGTPAC
jgi:hypothetical protein